jgi:hypothetical protein
VPSNPLSQDEVIASRELHVVGSEDKVLVEIGKPRKADVDAQCPYRIHYRDHIFGMDIFGIDEFQALQLAMKHLPIDLRHLPFLPVGKIYQFEPGDDMGFSEKDGWQWPDQGESK